jgi:glycosyltransferase involved in cell wall biosynthesis
MLRARGVWRSPRPVIGDPMPHGYDSNSQQAPRLDTWSERGVAHPGSFALSVRGAGQLATDMTCEKLALFVPTFSGGGAERVMITLAGAFVAAGCSVDLLTASARGPLGSEVSKAVRVVDFDTGRVMKAIPRLCLYLRRECPRVLLATAMHANVVALLAKMASGARTRIFVREASNISMAKATNPTSRGRLLPLFARRIYRTAEGIIAPSKGVKDDMVVNHGIPQARVRVIYNPVVDDRLFAMAAEPASHPWVGANDKSLVLGVGRLSKEKEFSTLVRAFRLVRNASQSRLLILGEGKERHALLRLIAELGLEGDVDLPGFVANPFAVMARASVFVLSSRFEGLPNALIQALALGVRLVATDCPSGPREVLEDGRHGTLVRVGDAEGMAEGILEQLQRKDAVVEREIASARFRVRDIAQNYLALFDGVVRS